jgi:hypothetical protein
MADFARHAGFNYSLSGQFGQVWQHVEDLPPSKTWSWRMDTVDPAWSPSAESFASVDFDSLLISPPNFMQRIVVNAPIYEHPRSVVDYTSEAIAWAVEQEPELDVYLYEVWPDFRRVLGGDPFPPDAMEWAANHALMAGEYRAWHLDYLQGVRARHPEVNVRLIPVGSVLSRLMTETALDAVPVTDWFTDRGPHGTESLYFLAAMITYTVMYGTPPPVDYLVPSNIIPAVRDNYASIRTILAPLAGPDT